MTQCESQNSCLCSTSTTQSAHPRGHPGGHLKQFCPLLRLPRPGLRGPLPFAQLRRGQCCSTPGPGGPRGVSSSTVAQSSHGRALPFPQQWLLPTFWTFTSPDLGPTGATEDPFLITPCESRDPQSVPLRALISLPSSFLSPRSLSFFPFFPWWC